MKISEAEEEVRLKRLEEFEQLKFYPWLEWMATAASLSVSEILAVLQYAVTEPLVTNLTELENHSFQYRKFGRFIGHTPIETACLMFVADHWRANQPIPSRDIIWNEEYGSKRTDCFISTLKYLQRL